MRISILRRALCSIGAAGLFTAASLSFVAPPAAAEGYMSATPPANGTPPHAQEARERTGEHYAGLGTPSAESRRLSPWTKAVFFQGRDPNDREAVKRLGTHPGAAGM